MTHSWFKWPALAPSIAEVALLDLLVASAYTLIALGGMAADGSLLGKLVSGWIELMEPAVSCVFFFLPSEGADVSKRISEGLRIYRHAVVMCSAITIGCIVLSAKYWPYWSGDFLRRLKARNTPAPRVSERIVSTYRFSIMGVAATAFLLLLAEPRDTSTLDLLYGHGWMALRAPLLLSLICCFACHALMLRRLLPPEETE